MMIPASGIQTFILWTLFLGTLYIKFPSFLFIQLKDISQLGCMYITNFHPETQKRSHFFVVLNLRRDQIRPFYLNSPIEIQRTHQHTVKNKPTKLRFNSKKFQCSNAAMIR